MAAEAKWVSTALAMAASSASYTRPCRTRFGCLLSGSLGGLVALPSVLRLSAAAAGQSNASYYAVDIVKRNTGNAQQLMEPRSY
jgi:hypothetical protein